MLLFFSISDFTQKYNDRFLFWMNEIFYVCKFWKRKEQVRIISQWNFVTKVIQKELFSFHVSTLEWNPKRIADTGDFTYGYRFLVFAINDFSLALFGVFFSLSVLLLDYC